MLTERRNGMAGTKELPAMTVTLKRRYGNEINVRYRRIKSKIKNLIFTVIPKLIGDPGFES